MTDKEPEKKVWVFKMPVIEPDATIETPVGPYVTSESKAAEYEKFLKSTEVHWSKLGAVGGQYTYSFTATSMGLVLEVVDAISKRKVNLTDFNSW